MPMPQRNVLRFVLVLASLSLTVAAGILASTAAGARPSDDPPPPPSGGGTTSPGNPAPSTSSTTAPTTTTTASTPTAVSLPAPLPTSTGTTFYVSRTGSDTNPGTQLKPWKTIQKAVNTILPGQRVLVRAGTYPEWVIWDKRNGTPTATMTLAAYSGERVVIAGRLKVVSDYVRVSGLVLQGQNSVNPTDASLYIANGDHVEISGTEITKGAISGVFMSASDDVRLLNNWIHDNGTHARFDHGVYLNSGVGCVIANNKIERNMAYGIHLYPDADNTLVTGNTVSSNGLSGLIIAGGSSVKSEGNRIESNLFTYNGEYGIRAYWSGTPGVGNVARGNTAYGNTLGQYPTGTAAAGITWENNL